MGWNNALSVAAKRIVELLDLVANADRAAYAAKEPEERWRWLIEMRALRKECDELQDRLADEFGSGFGWRRAKTRFSLEKLGRQPVHGGFQIFREWPLLDHPTCFREPDRPFRPAAIVAHNYGLHPQDGPVSFDDLKEYTEEIEEFAAPFNLEATIITDFPSWYYPGHTTLVLYRPLKTLTPFGPASDPADGPTEEMLRESEADVAKALMQGFRTTGHDVN